MGCGCMAAIIGMTAPRVAMVLILVFKDWFSEAFDSALWPILGFVFMPYATLAYMAAQLNGGELKGGWMALFIVAILVDFGHWGGGSSAARRRK